MAEISIQPDPRGGYLATVPSEEGDVQLSIKVVDAAKLSDGRLAESEATARAAVEYLLRRQDARDLPALADLGDIAAAYPDAMAEIADIRG